MKPIKPSEIAKVKIASIPDKVIEAFNELITENYSNGYAMVMQNTVVARISTKMDCPRIKVFAEGWLDIESLYEKAGWKVEYDKPGYNETYEANFKFMKR